MILQRFDDGLVVHHLVDPASAAEFREGVATAYVEIFADEPYLEHFTLAEARGIWDRLTRVPGSITLVVTDGDKVVGFAVAIPLRHNVEVAKALSGLVPKAHTMYLAELGVLRAYRGRGLGKKLVMMRLALIDENNFTHVVLRVSEKRKASRLMYQALDFEEMGVDMTVTSRRIDGTVTQDRRSFMSRLLSQVKRT